LLPGLASHSQDISYAASGSSSGKAAIKANVVDFAGSDSVLSESDYASYPDLQMFPTVAAAVVPVYNVPLLPATTIETPSQPSDVAPGVTVGDRLVFSRGLLADMFEGKILHWNDSRIAAENPHIADRLPFLAVTRVVRAKGSGTTAILATVLRSASSSFATSALPEGDASLSLPSWPVTNATVLSTLKAASKNEGVASRVVSVQGALGYVVANEAIKRGLSIGLMRNRAGLVVDADTSGVLFSLMELGGRFDSHLTADLSDASSSFSWPAVGYTYLIFRKTTTPQLVLPLAAKRGTVIGDEESQSALLAATDDQSDALELLGEEELAKLCQTRVEAVSFWQWFYTSPIVAAGAERLGFATLPEVVRDQVLGTLLREVKCGPNSAIAQEEAQSVPVVGSQTVASAMALFRSAYSVVDPSVDLDFNSASSVANVGARRRLSLRGEEPFSADALLTALVEGDSSAFATQLHAWADQRHTAAKGRRSLAPTSTSRGTSEEEAIAASLTFGDTSAQLLNAASAKFSLVLRPPTASWASVSGASIATASAQGMDASSDSLWPGFNASSMLEGSVVGLPGFAALSLIPEVSGSSAGDASIVSQRLQSLVVPFAVVGLTPVYSLPSLPSSSTGSELQLSLVTMAKIFMGDITTWDHPDIAAENPQASAMGLLPAHSITIFVQAGRSESTRMLTSKLAAADARAPCGNWKLISLCA